MRRRAMPGPRVARAREQREDRERQREKDKNEFRCGEEHQPGLETHCKLSRDAFVFKRSSHVSIIAGGNSVVRTGEAKSRTTSKRCGSSDKT